MSTTTLTTIPTAPAAPTETTESGEPSEGSESAPATETAAEITTPADTPDPDLEISRKLDSAAKREARARKQEVAMQSMRTQMETERVEMAKMKAELEAALDDPVSYYLQKGKDPVEVAKRFARPVSEEEKRIQKLEDRIAKDEQEREKQRQETETRAQTARRHEVMRNFVSGIKPDEYPHLTSVHSPEKVPTLVMELLNRHDDPSDPESPTILQSFKERFGRAPTDKEIRDALEHEAEVYAMSLIERLPKLSAPSQVSSPTPPAIEESTSLSNQHASSSSSSASRTKSREERMRELKAELEAEASAND